MSEYILLITLVVAASAAVTLTILLMITRKKLRVNEAELAHKEELIARLMAPISFRTMKKSGDHVFIIRFSGKTEIGKGYIWPDGDAPPNPTVYDVATKIKSMYPKADLINKWFLDNYIKFHISGPGGSVTL